MFREERIKTRYWKKGRVSLKLSYNIDDWATKKGYGIIGYCGIEREWRGSIYILADCLPYGGISTIDNTKSEEIT